MPGGHVVIAAEFQSKHIVNFRRFCIARTLEEELLEEMRNVGGITPLKLVAYISSNHSHYGNHPSFLVGR